MGTCSLVYRQTLALGKWPCIRSACAEGSVGRQVMTRAGRLCGLPIPRGNVRRQPRWCAVQYDALDWVQNAERHCRPHGLWQVHALWALCYLPEEAHILECQHAQHRPQKYEACIAAQVNRSALVSAGLAACWTGLSRIAVAAMLRGGLTLSVL